MSNIMTTVYAGLNVTAITNMVDDISPYVRARDTSFPAITYQVPDQQMERISTGVYRVASSVEVICIDRSVQGVEAVAEKVLETIIDDSCNVVDNVQREYLEGYDDDSVGMFFVTINYTNYGA